MYPAVSHHYGKHIQRGLLIQDMEGGFLGKMTQRVYGLMKKVGALTQNNYPETAGQIFIINAPYLFMGVYAVCKHFVDEKTRQKV